MSDKSPKQLLLRNIFSNWAIMFITIIIAFFMNPFLVHNLGKEQYGIWALILSVVAYSNFLDAGMKQSLARFIPKYYATKDFDGLNEVLNSSNLIYLVSGSLVTLATITSVFFVTDIFNIKPDLIFSMQVAFVVIGLNHALRFYFITYSSLGPFHRYDVGNAIDTIVAIVNALIIVYFIKIGYGIVALAITTISTELIKHSTRAVFQRRIVPEIKYKLSLATKKCVKELLSYGYISFLIVVSWMIIFQTDNIIIGIYLTTTDITYFSIAGALINYLRTLINAIGIPLVPAISHLDTTSDMTEIAQLYDKLSRYLFYLCTGICILLLTFGGDFITLWMGPDFKQTITILHILIVPASIYLPQLMANSVLLGISKHKSLLVMLASEAISKIILSIIFVQIWGLYGLAFGTVIPQFIIYTFIFPYIFHKIIKADLKLYYSHSVKMILFAILFCLPVSLLVSYFSPLTGWIGLVMNVGISMVLFILGFFKKILDNEDKSRLGQKLPAPIRKIFI